MGRDYGVLREGYMHFGKLLRLRAVVVVYRVLGRRSYTLLGIPPDGQPR